MRVLCSFVVGCLVAAAVSAQEFLRPEQLSPGMKGYGLSVFRGTKPERFEVEIIGVLKNTMPKQDMILIKMSGANLEHHKVIAGMSGSPIYIEGKLIGALAYGWTFENDPLAGVTPIHNMLAEIDRKAEPSGGLPTATGAASESAPRALLTPLSLGGFSARSAERLGEEFRPFGLLPVAGGGAGGALKKSDAEFEPGGAIGVQLMRGDLDATAVGTVSYVDRKRHRVLAFGHPFFHAGLISAPAVHAEVQTVMSSLQRSFKMATPLSERGAMVGDWQSCIVADSTATARMIPLAVRVVNRGTKHDESFSLEVLEHPVLTPRLIGSALSEVISTASASSQDTMLEVNLVAELADRTVTVTNTFFNPSGGLFHPGEVMPLMELFSSRFGQPKVKRITVSVEATLARRTAEIKRAYFVKTQADRGEKAELRVVLKPFGQPEVTRSIAVPVPAMTETLRELVVVVMGGGNAPSDVAAPDSLGDHLDAIGKHHRTTELVTLVQSSSQGLQYRGKLLKKLPPSALGVLDGDAVSGVPGAADVQQLVAPTEWVISGSAVARVPIRQE